MYFKSSRGHMRPAKLVFEVVKGKFRFRLRMLCHWENCVDVIPPVVVIPKSVKKVSSLFPSPPPSCRRYSPLRSEKKCRSIFSVNFAMTAYRNFGAGISFDFGCNIIELKFRHFLVSKKFRFRSPWQRLF